MADRGIELERIEPERAVAVHDDDLLVGLGELGAEPVRQADPHGAERAGIEPVAGHIGRHRLAAVVEDLLAVHHQDGVALHEVLDLVAQPQRMDRNVVPRLIGVGRHALGRLAVGELLAPGGEAILVEMAVGGGQNLAQHHLAIADDADVDLSRRSRDLVGVDVDAGDLRRGVEARRRRMADDVVHPRADHDDEIGLAKRGRAHAQVGVRMVVRQHAAALGRGVERDAALIDELGELGPGLGPDHAAARKDDRLLGLADRVDERRDLPLVAQRTRVEQRPPGQAPVDLLLRDLRVENVAGEIEIDRTGLAEHRPLERVVHLLGNALEVVDPVGPLGARLHDRELVDLLKHLAPELPDRARAADRHHRCAVDQRVGDSGRQIDDAGAARRHADARLLQQAAVGLAHEGGGLLVADVERPNAFLDAGGFREQHRAAHQEKQDVGALVLERARQNFRTGQFRHGVLPLSYSRTRSRRWRASPSPEGR